MLYIYGCLRIWLDKIYKFINNKKLMCFIQYLLFLDSEFIVVKFFLYKIMLGLIIYFNWIIKKLNL